MVVRQSWLFVPGDRPERFVKAERSGAHAVVCDLEDGVLPEHKADARTAVRDWLSAGGRAYVRVNPVTSAFHHEDVAALTDLIGLLGFLVPKCEGPDEITRVRRQAGSEREVIALIETAIGLARIGDILGTGAVTRLGFGSVDYATDLGIAHTSTALLFARSTLVQASRAAGVEPPLDGVTARYADDETNGTEAADARELGFGGKMCIHPTQVPVINEAFLPTEDELAWARQVLDTDQQAAHGAFAVAGELIDGPQLIRARHLLQVAERLSPAPATRQRSSSTNQGRPS